MATIEAWDSGNPWPEGCDELLLIGPPGTGKTRAVLDRYVFPVLRQSGVVLATSYTKAAAGELRERTATALGGEPDGYREMLSTIHSEATRRVRHLGVTIGGDTKGKAHAEEVDDDADAMQHAHARICEEQIRSGLEAWEATRQRYPQDIGLPPRQRLARVLSGSQLDLAEVEVMHDLASRTDESGKLMKPDYTSTLELALTSGTDRGVDLLAVDEAQDLTPLQWALIDRWRKTAKRFLVVGDPDQAIYAWAGADGIRLLNWLRSGKPARRLARSWRVPRAPHRLARRVVSQIIDREDAPYTPRDADGRVRAVTPGEAWDHVAEAQERGASVMVLSRSTRGTTTCIAELLEAGVPHIAEKGWPQVLGADSKPSILLSIVRALTALSYGRSDPRAQDAKRLIKAIRVGSPLLPARGAKKTIEEMLNGRHDRVDRDSLGLDLALINETWSSPNARWWEEVLLNVNADNLLVVRDWYNDHGDDLFQVAGHVIVTNAHGSKGREADLVVLDARARNRGVDDEDRRVLYVAITRTRDTLDVIRGNRDWLDQHHIANLWG